MRVLEAVADLSIGNVTLSAGRLRASRLTRGSVLVAGLGGLVSEVPTLTFTQATLSTPTLKTDRIGSDVDIQGNVLA